MSPSTVEVPERAPDSTDDKDLLFVFSVFSVALIIYDYIKRFGESSYREITAPKMFRRTYLPFDLISSVYTDSGFRRAFRMDRAAFESLLKTVKDDLTKNEDMGIRAGRPVVKPDVRLAVTIRLMAGAKRWDLMPAYWIGESTVLDVFHQTVDVLMSRLELPGLPRTVVGLRQSAERFKTSRYPPNPLSGCVGALDGIAVRIKKPRDDNHPAAYFCRKGFYSLPIQCVVDANYTFLCFSARCVGSTHDSVAHAVSALGDYLEQGLLRKEFWIAGDDAYLCSESLITPYPMNQTSGNTALFNFNFFHSSLRMHIEQAFGMLVAKWEIVKEGLDYSVERNSRIACLATKLHNFCITRNSREDQFFSSLSSSEKMKALKESEEWYEATSQIERERLEEQRAGTNGRRNGSRRSRRTVSRKREEMIRVVEKSGLVRPPVRSRDVTAIM